MQLGVIMIELKPIVMIDQMTDRDVTLLTKEWELCEQAIGRFDTLHFQVRGWAVSAFGVVSAVAFSMHEQWLFAVGASMVAAFWIVEANFKVYQLTFVKRCQHVQRALRGDLRTHHQAGSNEIRGFPAIANEFQCRREEHWLEQLLRIIKALREINVCLPYLLMIAICGFGFFITPPKTVKPIAIKIESMPLPPQAYVTSPAIPRRSPSSGEIKTQR
jgi:hypothetical protein